MPVRARAFPIEPERLPLSFLALFVGQSANQRVVSELRAGGLGDVRQSYGYLIQHLLAGPRSVGELAKALGVSQQAASKSVSELVRTGYVEATAAEDARVRLIRLSERGHAAVLAARRSRDKLERRLERKLGTERYEAARVALADVLEELGGADAVRGRRVRDPASEP